MQYTHCNEELQEGGEYQCDYTIFDSFLEHIAQQSIQKNVFIASAKYLYLGFNIRLKVS